MRKALFAVMVLLLAIAAAPMGQASGAEPIRTPIEAKFPVTAAGSSQYDLVQAVVDLAPGASTPAHMHGGPEYVTVIAGQITLLRGGTETAYGPGQSFVVPESTFFIAANKGTANAQFLASFLLSPGGTFQINDPRAPAPAIGPKSVSYRTTTTTLPAKFDFVQQVWDWDPGAKSPVHVMNHPHVMTMIEGENTIRYQDGRVVKVVAGQSAIMTVGQAGTMENSGSGNNRFAITWLAGSTAPLFTPAGTAAGAISPPNTGDGGLLAQGQSIVPFGLLAGVLSGLTLVLLMGMRRQSHAWK
ncbi:MAG TPA: cupin domain-containing protein [Dehalococcoidia bacterium]|nr:cupin domain-containing protein [Dehalococcoidia bacterium]